jgi:hypothetical protein
MKYAIIDNNKVINIAKADKALADNWIQSDTAQIGWIYDTELKIFSPEAISFDTSKKEKIDSLVDEITNYIEDNYSPLKQRSDVADKEYWGAWLITHFPNTYTTDNLYQKFFNSAAKIIEGVSDFDTEVNSLKEVTTFADTDEETKYSIALEQLLKVAIRQGWVQSCKVEYNIKTQLVNNATTIDNLETIELNFLGYPLND